MNELIKYATSIIQSFEDYKIDAELENTLNNIYTKSEKLFMNWEDIHFKSKIAVLVYLYYYELNAELQSAIDTQNYDISAERLLINYSLFDQAYSAIGSTKKRLTPELKRYFYIARLFLESDMEMNKKYFEGSAILNIVKNNENIDVTNYIVNIYSLGSFLKI